MVRSVPKDNSNSEARNDLNYPGSPRSQRWIANLLPVLERYNYNCSEIIQLVQSCDYNGDRIQDEVDRILEINLGHEQGEWTVVKQHDKVKQPPSPKASKAASAGSRKGGNRSGGNKEPRPQRNPVTIKTSAQPSANTGVVGTVPSTPVAAAPAAAAAKVITPKAAQTPTVVAKEPHKESKEKDQPRDVRKQPTTKETAKEAQKPPQTSGMKKGFPLQWASLLKTVVTEDKTVEQPASQPQAPAAEPAETTTPKANRKTKKENSVVEPKPKPETPKVKADIEAIAIAQAEEALKKLELVEPEKTGKTEKHRPAPAEAEVEERPPVVMPKPLAPGIDASIMFGCFEEEVQKPPTYWPGTASLNYYQQVSHNRQNYGKYSRASHQLRADQATGHNMMLHEAEALVHHEVGAMQQDHSDTLHGDSSHMQDTGHEGGFSAQWQMNYYGNRYSNPKHQPFSYAYDEDKHKPYRQGGTEHYPQKDGRHPGNAMYFNYGYQHDRLQTPPGLVGFYTPQQPFYGFPNSNSQGNPPGTSDSMSSSMWRN